MYEKLTPHIDIIAGEYALVLKFAEVYFQASGEKVFNVDLNGLPAVRGLDIFAEVGPLVNKKRACDLIFETRNGVVFCCC